MIPPVPPDPAKKAWAEPLPLPPADADLARLYDVWNAQRGTAATPDHACIRAEAFAFILGRVNVVDVDPSGPCYTFRIFGTQIGRYRDIQLTGRSTEELKPRQYRDLIEAHYAAVHATRAPALHEVYMSDGAVVRRYRRLLVPYATPDHPAGKLVSGTVFPESIKEVVQSPAFLRDD
jgi:hypothetical protein